MTAATLPHADLIFRAFADPTRLRLMNLLQDQEEVCVCDLMNTLDLPQAKVSRHLAYLRRAELVETRKDGQWVYYRLAPSGSAFHAKMLECLQCCFAEVPELQADRDRLCGGDCC
ncbi:ArsR/SmtB family transcription factor [Algisphaera agarilytica]|uniref:ArsR family transcriptional regulator n=1 Tax=Algisphaera agarilytica TaxID=1385975 RepID=A0A7X0LKJ6_9BACT|nr:metalloregulator ArsR/SmtB family transcription factor [Algisphaera agarilytica]MBB6430500.1 ArsR family transcriptional regulator [Algisphaera agarilytica]